MGTDQIFKVLAKPRNGINKQFKVLNGLVVDETESKVDFNGTYKDMRGTFAVVHGVIDKRPCQSVQEMLC